MTIEQSSNFFVASILTMLGFIVITAGIIAINNLISKYWKPVKIFHPDSWRGFNPPHYIREEPINDDIKKSSRTEVQRT
jgi:hypothetical protein